MIYCDDNNPHSYKTSLRDKGHMQKLKAAFTHNKTHLGSNSV